MTKKAIIKKINSIIREYGSFTTADVQADSSPCISSKKGRNELVERFEYGKGEVIVTDKNDEEIDSEYVNYEDMKKDVLEEILVLAEIHEAESLQDEDRQGKNQL